MNITKYYTILNSFVPIYTMYNVYIYIQMQNDTRLSLGYKSYFTERYQLESVSFFKKKKNSA